MGGGWLPRISNNGYVTWEAVTVIAIGVRYAHEVILYDGETVMQITENTVFEGVGGPVMWPRIDRNGNVFWNEPDYRASSWRILMYDGNQVNEMAARTGDCSLSTDYDFNIHGEIVFVESCGDNSSIYFSDGITEVKIVDDTQLPPPILGVQISDEGHVLWGGRDIYVALPVNTSYLATANAEASTFGSASLTGSGSLNALGILLMPLAVVFAIRFRRKKERMLIERAGASRKCSLA